MNSTAALLSASFLAFFVGRMNVWESAQQLSVSKSLGNGTGIKFKLSVCSKAPTAQVPPMQIPALPLWKNF